VEYFLRSREVHEKSGRKILMENTCVSLYWFCFYFCFIWFELGFKFFASVILVHIWILECSFVFVYFLICVICYYY
jgi:hypothetical protein